MTNWSVVLNVLLLVAVLFAMFRLFQTKRKATSPRKPKPVPPQASGESQDDDIIAVRRIDVSEDEARASYEKAIPEKKPKAAPAYQETASHKPQPKLYMFLLAKEEKNLAGYELLQTILSEGLRIGDDNMFHRHQHTNGQGPVICSLATATADGTFDIQNIGGFSVHGLCLFMEASGNPSIDAERLGIMVGTAESLSEGLDTHLLDDDKQAWSDASLARYEARLNIREAVAQ